MSWLRYANEGKIRNQPISPELQQALSFLGDMGVTMEVFSGGQAAKGSGGPRTGSTRHDHGGAADVFFYKDGRRLDWSNPDDLPIFREIVQRGKQNGVTGWGAGDGYMSPGSMHVGFGNEAVWGAGGKGANAASWLRESYSGAPSGVSGQVTASAPQSVGAEAYSGAPYQQGPQNALAALPEPVREAMTYNALAQMFGGGSGNALEPYRMTGSQTPMMGYT